MSIHKKPAYARLEQQLVGQQDDLDGKRGARDPIEDRRAARNALAAAFMAPPVSPPGRAEVIVRRKRLTLPPPEEADKRPAETDADRRPPRVFRLATKTVSGKAVVSAATSPNAESSLGDLSPQDAVTLPPVSPLERSEHDRRRRPIRRSGVASASLTERVNEAELLSQEVTLANRLMKLTDCANALRELKQRRIAGWAPLEARVQRIRSRMEGLRQENGDCGFVPLLSATSEMLIELGELSRKVDVMQGSADAIGGILPARRAQRHGKR